MKPQPPPEKKPEPKPEVKPAPATQQPSAIPTIKAKLRGEVVTADTRGAGTDAKVTLWVTDVNGKVIGPMLVREEGEN